MELLDQIRAKALASLRPPQRLPLSEWAPRNIKFPQGVNNDPGWMELWPPQRGIGDAITDPFLERVTVLKCVRVGYTTLLTAAIASYGLNEPSPMLLYMPTDDDCRDYVVSDMEPIFDASPAVAGLFSTDADESGRSTITQRRFPGGYLKVLAAKSPRNFRRHSARVLLIDEEDGMEPTKEGDPVTLAERRTLGFVNRKIIRGSTPTDASVSTILQAYRESDMRIYEVPCPSCGARHQLVWADIRFPDGPESAHWRCPTCEEAIAERFKAEMVSKGAWRATRPEVKGHAGFHLNALISLFPNASWSKLADEFLRAHKDPERLRVFKNTLLAEAWEDAADTIDDEVLFQRREAFGLAIDWADEEGELHRLDIPAEVLLITCGVDVQDDRVEATLLGWSENGTAFVLGHFVFYGSPEEDGTWRELDEMLLSRWTHPLGGRIGIDAACVDSGDGGWTDEVYAFCVPRLRRGVMAIKGMAGFSRPVIEASKGKIRGGSELGRGTLWIVGSDAVKTQLMNRVTRAPESLRFSKSLPRVWFEQFASERRVVRRIGGRPVRKYERIGAKAAEALDCTVYAFAARSAIPLADFNKIRARLRGEPTTQPTVRPATPKDYLGDTSNFL